MSNQSPEGAKGVESEIPKIEVEWNQPFKLLPRPKLPSEISLREDSNLARADISRKLIAQYDLSISGVPQNKLVGEYSGIVTGGLSVAASLNAVTSILAEIQKFSHRRDESGIVELAGLPQVSFVPRYINEDGIDVELVATQLPLVMGGFLKDIPNLADMTDVTLFALYHGKVVFNWPERDAHSVNAKVFHETFWRTDDRRGSHGLGILYLPYDSNIFDDMELVIGNKEPQREKLD